MPDRIRTACVAILLLALIEARDIDECLAPDPMEELAIIRWNDDGEPIDRYAWIDAADDVLLEMLRQGGFPAAVMPAMTRRP